MPKYPKDTISIEPTKQVPVIRAGRSLVVLIVFGLAVHLLLPQIAEFKHSMDVIKNMTLWFVVLAVVMQILSYVGSGYLLQTLIAVAGQHISIMIGLIITLAASSIGLVAGGVVGNAAATYRWLTVRKVHKEGAMLAGWLPLLFNNAVLVVIGLVGVLHLFIVHELSTIQIVGFGLTLALLVATMCLSLWGVYHRSKFVSLISNIAHRWVDFRKRAYNQAGIEDTVSRYFKAWDVMYKGGWHKPLNGALLNTVFDMMTLYFLFIAAGHNVSPGVLLTGYGLPMLLGKISIFPGGVGIVESTMAVLYNGLGVPNAVTVVVILTYRVISFWLPTLMGFPLALYLQRTVDDRDL